MKQNAMSQEREFGMPSLTTLTPQEKRAPAESAEDWHHAGRVGQEGFSCGKIAILDQVYANTAKSIFSKTTRLQSNTQHNSLPPVARFRNGKRKIAYRETSKKAT